MGARGEGGGAPWELGAAEPAVHSRPVNEEREMLHSMGPSEETQAPGESVLSDRSGR